MAAGQGKRMNSELPKVLHKVDGLPMLVRIINQASKLNPAKIFVVVGKHVDIIGETLSLHNIDNVQFVVQKEQLGTGDAIKALLPAFSEGDMDATNIILNGDAPLITFGTIDAIYRHFVANTYDLQITCIDSDTPAGNGRIISNEDGLICQRIVEEKDCTDEQRLINVVNCGIYVATVRTLVKLVPMITNNNKQNEYYLTDIVELAISSGHPVGLYQLDKSKQVELSNVNTREQLDTVNRLVTNYK